MSIHSEVRHLIRAKETKLGGRVQTYQFDFEFPGDSSVHVRLTSLPTFLRKDDLTRYVCMIQQYVLRTSSGISFVWMQSMGLPTYCRVVTMREKARRIITVRL